MNAHEKVAQGRRRWLAIVAVACSAFTLSSCQAQRTPPPAKGQRSTADSLRSGKVLSIQRQVSLAAPTSVVFSARDLNDVPLPQRPRAAIGPVGVTRFLGTAAQNARIPVALANGPWSVAWAYPLKVDGTPVVVLEAHDRVLLQAGDWYLLQGDGVFVSKGALGRSALTADGTTNVFFLVNQANSLEARSLANGELQFRWPLAFGEAFSFPLINRMGWRIQIAGVEHRLFGHPPTEPTMGVVYLLEMSGAATNPAKVLTSVKRSETLIFDDPFMLTAMSAERTAIASKGQVAFVSGDLQVEAVYVAPGLNPTLLSVDESGWMYVVSQHGDERSLWVISPEGKRVVHVPLDRNIGAPSAPPAIGYDRRIYLWNASAVYAFAADGTPLWEWRGKGGIEGIGLTADDRVLVSAGEDVSAINATGQGTVLFRMPGERVAGPPILAGNGDLLVPTRTHLYRLRSPR